MVLLSHAEFAAAVALSVETVFPAQFNAAGIAVEFLEIILYEAVERLGGFEYLF
jgi:mannose/fructose-specific phosphotransferase system component IIA